MYVTLVGDLLPCGVFSCPASQKCIGSEAVQEAEGQILIKSASDPHVGGVISPLGTRARA